jgi:LPS-assembly protein
LQLRIPSAVGVVAPATILAAALALGSAYAQAPAAPGQAPKGPTTIDAERIDGVSDLEVRARGRAEIKRDDMTIFGEELRFNREFGRFEGEGGTRIEQGTDRFFGPRLRYRSEDGTGEFTAPSYLLQGDPPGRGSAERVDFLGPGRYRMTNATYTTCKPGDDDWVLEGEEFEIDRTASRGTVRNAKLRFFDYPIGYAPYFSFSLDRQRKSGFLPPTYSRSTRRGFEVGVPYYWNIAPEMDATLTPVFMTKRGEQLKSEFRYLGGGKFGEVHFEHLPKDTELGRSRTGASVLYTNFISRALYVGIDYNHASDHRYFIDLANSRVRRVSNNLLSQDGQVNYSDSLLNTRYDVNVRLFRYQSLQDPLAPFRPPYDKLPQVTVSATKYDIGGLADLVFPQAEYIRFTHPTLIEGHRFSMNPSVAMPLLAPGYFITPKVGFRQANYMLDRTAPGQPTRPSVTVPWMSLDGGLIFERPTSIFGQALTQTLEPRMYYVYVPYRDQSQLPDFDTGLQDLSYTSMFTENRFAGGDRFGDANQITFAATSRLFGGQGIEVARATVAQRYHFQAERVVRPGLFGRTAHSSDLLASLGGRVTRALSFETAVQLNAHRTAPGQTPIERFNSALRYSPEIAKVLNLNYRFSRAAISQFDVSGQWPIAAGWYGIGRFNYSVLDKRLLEGLAAIEYNAGCWLFRVVGRRVQAAVQVTTTEFLLQLEFNGLGQIGSDDTLTYLKRNVPGYAPTNPADRTLVPPSLRPQLPFQQVF